jgi:hypothetical protein
MLRVACVAPQYLARVRHLAAPAVVGLCAGLLAAAPTRGDTWTLDRVAPGHWGEIPDSALRKVAPGEQRYGSVARITAWSGGAFDPDARQLLVWGGGHEDYAGNEVYAFDLKTFQWKRLTEAAKPDRKRSEVYADGSPRSRHTYNYIEFVPSLHRMLSFGGASLYPRGGATTHAIAEFDPETGSWITGRRRDVPRGGSMIGAHARLDPASGDVFFVPSQRGAMARYSPDEDRWYGGWDPAYVRVHSTAAIDPVRRLLVLVGSGTDQGQLIKWDLDLPTRATDLRAITTGDKDIERAYAPGFDYHGPTGKFVAWTGGAAVHVLDPDDWHWTRLPPAPGNSADPGPAQRTGTYGRFRYVPGVDVFVLMNGVDRNVFVYRLPPL